MECSEIKVTHAPLISVVIVNYNHGRFLEQAIRSVVDQDGFDDAELIVVDGGSTDNSVEVIRCFEDRLAWWVSEKDKGQSDAFNKGFSHACGRFGCWLNADDIMMPGALNSVRSCIERHPVAEWICGSSVFADGDLRVKWCSRCVRTWPILQRKIPWYAINGPSSFFLIERLRQVGGFDIKMHYAMDTDLWRRFVRHGMRLYYVKDYIWCFRVHEESKTSHKFITGKGSVDYMREGSLMNSRYGISRTVNKLGSRLNRFARFVSGTYIWSWIDTRRNKGRPIWDAIF